jgi:hypothetical protein
MRAIARSVTGDKRGRQNLSCRISLRNGCRDPFEAKV